MPLSLYCSSPVHLPPAMSQLPLYLQVLGFPLDQLVKWAFTTPVQFWCGLRFHRGAITALRNGGPSGLPPPASCHPHFPPAPPHAVLSPAYVLCHRPSVFGYAPPALVHADMLGYPQLSTRPRPLAPPPPLVPPPSGRANMDVLVSLGTSAAYAYSAISIIHHHFARHHATGNYQPTDFFETSAMLVTLVLLGKYLEAAVSPASFCCYCWASLLRRHPAHVLNRPPTLSPSHAHALPRPRVRRRWPSRVCASVRPPAPCCWSATTRALWWGNARCPPPWCTGATCSRCVWCCGCEGRGRGAVVVGWESGGMGK